MSDEEMSTRQQAACARMIVEVGARGCALTIEKDEVTVYEPLPKRHGRHSHHRGASLYWRLSQALGTAKVWNAEPHGVEGAHTA